MKKVFIDGKAGTTGLRIAERLAMRDDVEIISLSDDIRKNADARKKIINEADIVFLCLPDAAAIEAVSMVENENTVIKDASTAHRTNPDWAYGLAELGMEFENKIRD
ncbi:MAG: N-acetyl-gamma-glutamyl-phosphate reductase, partial [Clostridia bacterium]|nr:N-acetyl-gamma-glutamyl-phosphate reductase [Clostridia bacterium]